MAIDFTNSPTSQQNFSSGGKNWVYNGTSWTLVGVSTAAPSNFFNLDGGKAATTYGGITSINGGGATG